MDLTRANFLQFSPLSKNDIVQPHQMKGVDSRQRLLESLLRKSGGYMISITIFIGSGRMERY